MTDVLLHRAVYATTQIITLDVYVSSQTVTHIYKHAGNICK